MLSETGAPTPVAWTRMRAPQSLMAPTPDAELDRLVAASPLTARYAAAQDRESAYEKLKAAQQASEPAPSPAPASAPAEKPQKPEKDDPGLVEHVVQSSAFRSMLRSAGTQIGREITRSLFGTARRRR